MSTTVEAGEWRTRGTLDEMFGTVTSAAMQMIEEERPADLKRLDAVEAWCAKRKRWFWPDVPQTWWHTFTHDLAALGLLGRMTVLSRSGRKGNISTTEYLVQGTEEQGQLF